MSHVRGSSCPVPQELMVKYISWLSNSVHFIIWLSYLQGLTQEVEMLVSAVMPIMSVYRLPQGQYT